MDSLRKLHLGAFMRPVSIHTAAWRYPGSWPDANFNFDHLKRLAQTLERGRFDAFFMADHLAVLNMPMQALKRSATVTSFDPLVLLPALAVVTDHLGLIATASTTYNEPYHIARKFASLDHLSGGRAGWNVVTSGNPHEAMNFGLEEHVEHAKRYHRAREFFDVVTGLWDSWADDAFVRDVEAGVYFDPARLHVLNHEGEHLKVRGPLNISRPVQGWPVIVQAGASEEGRQLAAETAEVIFGAGGSIQYAQSFYRDVKSRMPQLGRDPNHLKVLPGAFVVVGETVAEAREKRARLDSLVHYDSAIASLSIALGHDVSRLIPTVPCLQFPRAMRARAGGNGSRARRSRQSDCAPTGAAGRRLCRPRVCRYAGTIADQMEEWLFTEACDGFNVMFPYLPAGLDDFVDRVVPELQRRGLFRREYEGKTLRDNLGLPRPQNRFFPARTE